MSDYDHRVKELFSDLISFNRMPHAVLIEGGNESLRKEAATFLSHYAVCSESNRPCGVCKNCVKAKANSHSDIYTPKLSGKTNIINVDSVRDMIKNASVIPNEADTKVFILMDVDTSLPEISQNAFLKILEEPPLRTLFILTAKSRKKLLSTILSRVQTFTLYNEDVYDEETIIMAKEVIDGILSVSEAKLIYATAKLTDRVRFKEVISLVCEYLRQGLSCSVGNKSDDDTALSISKKLTKTKIIGLIELTLKAIARADRNVNMTLLCTWLCGEYRRISWLR